MSNKRHLSTLVLPAHSYGLDSHPAPDGTDVHVRNILRDPGLRAALALMPVIGGGAQGTNEYADVITQTQDGVPLNNLWRDFQASLNLLNAERQGLVDFLTFGVQNVIETVPQVSANMNFELASEYGEPVGVRQPGTYFQMGYSFEWYDLASRYTWKFLAEATAAQIEAIHNGVLEADNRLVFTEVMKTLFRNTNRSADINGNAYNVYAFYNADGTVPPAWKTYTHDGTHTHYLASGSATIDSGDLDESYEHLRHHGYGTVESGTKVVAMLNKAQVDVVRGFKSVQAGGTDTYDFIPAQGSQPFILPPNVAGLEGQRVAATLDGLTVVGSYGPVLIVEEDYIPAGYMVMFATGGRANLQNPIGIREHAQPGLRGMRLVKGRSNDYPLQDAFYQRGFGTGVRQRGGTVVMKFTAGSYTIPTEYQ